jgi:hypothetical protein
MAYTTNHGTSGNKTQRIGVRDSHGDLIGSAVTIDDGENWFITGLFSEVGRSFTSSQAAIEQLIRLYEVTVQGHLAAAF